jgi:hypothetical protein
MTFANNIKRNWLRSIAQSAIASLLFIAPSHAQATPAEPEKITQEELVRRTQELMDGFPSGDKGPWEKYLAADLMYFDEKGQLKDKTAQVAEIAPLPAGYSGTIKIVNPQSRIIGHTAILAYDMDETEIVYGRTLHARYHETDTWMWRDARWQMIAGQVLRYYEDPAVGEVNASRFADYVGTYEQAPGDTLKITLDGGKLYSQRDKSPRHALLPETTDLFFRPGMEGRFLFHRNAQGKVDEIIDRRNNEDLIWKRK